MNDYGEKKRRDEEVQILRRSYLARPFLLVLRARTTMRLLITGGLGFIGTNLARHIQDERPDIFVKILDARTYSANPPQKETSLYHFIPGDIRDPDTCRDAMEGTDAVIHLAAESHVDRSIVYPSIFVQTNVIGTLNLLQAAHHAGVSRFLHVGTDEVYGDLPEPLSADEKFPLYPSSPYAASKAAADMLCLSYHRTYGLPVIVTRSCNNYGPYQHSEKLIPRWSLRCASGLPMPLYGEGLERREWIHVEDNVRALLRVLDYGEPGGIYNIGSGESMSNLDMGRTIAGILDRSPNFLSVPDRPGHDRRYSLIFRRMHDLDWRPKHRLMNSLVDVVRGYAENCERCIVSATKKMGE